jgi:O-antigen/teichoic acid export membrane protein
MADSLKKQTFVGIGWSAVERFSVQGVLFVIQIVLARLLTPSDYGVIGMLAIFLQVAQVFIDSGFGNALIQKRECTEYDYSTVFWYNLGIAVFLYVCFFFGAPFIASFYNVDLLVPVLRVISLTLILNALSIVQKTKLIKKIDFKSQSKVTLLSVVISGAVGIYLASEDYGVWALVAQQITNSALQFILFFCVLRWIPKFSWSKESFNHVFNFGSKQLIASLIGVIYGNLYTLVIGKKFAAQSLGFYTRAEMFAQFPSGNIGGIISRVMLPVLSKIQDDNNALRNAYRKLIQFSSFIIFPLMFGIIAVANPFIISILTEKWAECIPMLQILCLSHTLTHLSTLNLNLLYVKGRTDLVLKLEIIKKTIAVIILLVTIPYGIIWMCWGLAIYSVIGTAINTYYTEKLIGLSLWKQILDFGPFLLNSAVMAIGAFMVTLLFDNSWLKLCFGITAGFIIYLILSKLFYSKIIMELLSNLKNLNK